MKIQILGMGCPKCEKTYRNVLEAAKELGVDPHVEKVSTLEEIMKFGVMLTPALVVDGEVKVVGKVPTVTEVKGYLAARK